MSPPLESLEPWLIPFIPSKGQTAVDVGANRGAWTAYLARRFDRVYAIEPNPAVLPELKANRPSNAEIIERGAWSAAGKREFTVYSPTELFSESTLSAIADRPIGRITLACATLDSLIAGPVDFIKVDTEGAEAEVLTGAAKILARDRPKLIIEVHHAADLPKLREFLDGFRYRLEEVREPLTREQVWLIGTAFPDRLDIILTS